MMEGAIFIRMMKYAEITSELSFSKRKKVGCVIAKEERILSSGHNKVVANLSYSCEDSLGRTRPDVIHAEPVAITNALKNGVSVEGATAYLTLSPCMDCARLLIQAGIRTVVFKEHSRFHDAIILMNEAGLEVWRLEDNLIRVICPTDDTVEVFR